MSSKTKSLTPLELAERYLIHIGLDKLFVKRALLPSKFDSTLIFKPMKTHNLVTKNKVGNKFTQTHIHINKYFWDNLFSSAQQASFFARPVTSNNQKSKQIISLFEANIAANITRRNKKISPSVVHELPSKTYSAGTNLVVDTYTYKLFNKQGSSYQVHIGIEDDNCFKDFRLGILLGDYLLLLKYAKKDSLLGISIPSEFCAKYSFISKRSISRATNSKELKKAKLYEEADGNYVLESNSADFTYKTTPLSPRPAPSKGGRSSSKPKYSGDPSIGKGALKEAKFLCECNPSHTSFISEKTGENYMEPHHLIPISKQGYYGNDIDITSNIVCLCPTCHKQIHYGKKNERERMLQYFFSLRKNNLVSCGIDIDIETLLAYYGIV